MPWASFTLDTLIENWGKTYKVSKNTNEGEHDALGIYAPPDDEWEDDFGVLAVMTNKMLVPADLGVYTSQDLYCITRSEYELGIWIKDGSRKFKVHERASYSFFDQTDLLVYKIKLDGGRLDALDD